MKELYIGLMSGTSLDSVDVALCGIDERRCELIASMEYPFDQALKVDILRMIRSETTLSEVGRIDHRLGMLFADAVNDLIEKERLDRSGIKAIGSHGQTLWHDPEGACPFSMQLGDPNIITVRTGIKTVADFRRKDIALGGQGAPFAPAFHHFLFKGLKRSAAVVNIGGMANITLLGDEVIGYDTGPGNVLIDLWIQERQGHSYDRNGMWACSGKINQELLDDFLSEAYFSKQPPKSTGRELFNREWLLGLLEKHGRIEPQDIQATLVELTVLSIAEEVKKHHRDLLLVCGGGAKNSFLMQRLGDRLASVEVARTDNYGANSDYLEAMAFSWLAYKRIHHEKVELKTVTGAQSNAVLGGIYE